ncbi:MAG: hypothetical protein LQ348_004005 [Seirophora lacunosa]|nr:MAG: hypothetical protein LQ344_004350 [Seirophora lacunosa]KAI4187913.1 MAG: hypothetical protein LQ348_004005 [Seirophora lacunosa]
MPSATTSDPTGHRHAASATNKRNISGVWTNHDDEQLKRARQQGHNWTTIAETYFPSKTPNACRKRHERLMEKINANGIWNPVKFEEVAKAYVELREEMWRKIADRVNEKWTVVESKVLLTSPPNVTKAEPWLTVVKCMEKGYKNLASMGRAASRKDRSPQNGEVEYNMNHDDGLMVDTHSHSEAEATLEESHPFSASSHSSNPSRRTTFSTSSASFASPLPRPTPTLPNFSQGFPTNLPGISSIVGPSGLPVTTH